MKSIKILLIQIACGWACTHTEDMSRKEFKAFPPRFYAEQTLTITSPGQKRQVKAQLQRLTQRGSFDLVLIDPMFQLVLAKASIDQESVRIIHLAAHLKNDSLPLDAIGAAIRGLYEATDFKRDGSSFTWQAPTGVYDYRLETIMGSEDCLYPKLIHLRFGDQRYELKIVTDSFSCTLE